MPSRTIQIYLVIVTACLGSAVAFVILAAATSDAPTSLTPIQLLLWAALPSLVLAAFVTWLIRRLLGDPIRGLRKTVHRAAEGNLSARITDGVTPTDPDVQELARDFDQLTARVRNHMQFRHRLMRNMADELRAPLSRLQAIASLIRQRSGTDSELAKQLESELDNLHNLIADVLSYSQLESRKGLKRQSTNIADMLRTIAQDAAGAAAERQVSVELNAPDELLVNVEHAILFTAIENLVRHALDRMNGPGALSITLSSGARDLLIAVEDGGPALDDEALDHLFEPFHQSTAHHFSGDSRQHTLGGVDLAVARRGVLLHGGNLHARNTGTGLLVSAVLPSG